MEGKFKVIVKLVPSGEWRAHQSLANVRGNRISEAIWSEWPKTAELDELLPAFEDRPVFIRTINDVIDSGPCVSESELYRLAKRTVTLMDNGGLELAKTPALAMRLADFATTARDILLTFGWLERYESEKREGI